MKKLMIAASAALCATVGFSDVTSANIVGYQNNETTDVKYPLFCFTFTPIAGGNTIKLGDIVASGNSASDRIQVINPTTLGSDVAYGYYSKANAEADAWEEAEEDPEVYEEILPDFLCDVGWWIGGHVGKAADFANNVDVTVGSGFLGLSPSCNNITFTSNGEAPTKAKSYVTGAVKYPFFGNFLPTRMYLKDLVVTGNSSSDRIQVINPTTLGSDVAYGYYSVAQAESDAWEEAEEDPEVYEEILPDFLCDVGWWIGGHVGKAADSADNVIVEAAQGFQGLSAACNNQTFNYKGVLDLTPIK